MEWASIIPERKLFCHRSGSPECDPFSDQERGAGARSKN